MALKRISIELLKYSTIVGTLLLGWFISHSYSSLISTTFSPAHQHTQTLGILFACVIIFSMGFLVYQLAKPTIIPSFVLATLFGIVTADVLEIIVSSTTATLTIITIGAVLILFDGGLEVPLKKFAHLFWPILSIALVGTMLTAMFLAFTTHSFLYAFGMSIPVPMLLLLGAALASTDPAAIIPCFKDLRFTQVRVKHLAISESAINDVAGAVLVSVLLVIYGKDVIAPVSIYEGISGMLVSSNITIVLQKIGGGLIAGTLGYFILAIWNNWKLRLQLEEGTDAALFLAVPLLSFMLAELMSGSGFLAVFITGLLFHLQSHFRHVEHYFNHTIEGFFKPMIFMILGALVSIEDLIEYAPLGISLGLFLLFILRPLVVLITLTPFHYTKTALRWREIGFMCFVRETGVIPAALLISIGALQIPGSQVATTLGLWVILVTLIVQPPLTPLIAKFLHVATDNNEFLERKHQGPVAVLCSRGNSYKERMKTVVDWAQNHDVENIALLHCPEEKYCKSKVEEVENSAKKLFKSINNKRLDQDKRPLSFEILCGPGLLQENIEKLIAKGDVSIIFVGEKMLDYRLEEVKSLDVPFYFMN